MKVNIGLVGFGYWGPNIARNFSQNPNASLKYICDLDKLRLKTAKESYPQSQITDNMDDLLKDEHLDLIAIATPVSTHFKLAYESILNGKHVFIEKPMTSRANDAEALIEAASKNKRKIFIDHTYIFTGAIKKLKDIIKQNDIGDIYYFDSVRVNLGLYQNDINVIWDLAPHDLSIMDYLIEQKAIAVSAIASRRAQNLIEDIAYVTIRFDNGLIAHFHVNWMSPVKIRRIIIGGDKRMIVFDELRPDEQIKIYDKGINVAEREGIYEQLIQYRIGDIHIPTIERAEALKTEISHVIDCIINNKEPIVNGNAGLRIVKMLEATDRSIKNNGVFVKL